MEKKTGKKEMDTLKKNLFRKPVPVWDKLGKKEQKNVFDFNDTYKSFLDTSKTEREAAIYIREAAEKNGFVNIETLKKGRPLPEKVYQVANGKMAALAVLGKEKISGGALILGSHIDSPRLDLKQNPLYEDTDLTFFKTHYYGGIKKYQWLARPLALHGRIFKNDGTFIDICIGESPDDPVFLISDLLPHLSGKFNGKKLSEAFSGEKLNLLIGSLPLGNEDVNDRFKLAIMKLLNEKYGIVEEDFISAEIEAVPAEKARDIGFDRSLVGAYGQDDRVCAFTSLQAILNVKKPAKCCVALFYDKEEIGSEGNTGAQSRFMDQFLSELLILNGEDGSEQNLRKTFMASCALSGDVNAAIEPDYKDVHEKRNAAQIGYGICVTKFTGVRGKSGSSDASAEYMSMVRNIFNKKHIVWQTGELGKIDEGGGGTIAKFLASYGINVLDAGPALLSMHSPCEIASKADVYMTYKAYLAFFESK